MQCRANPAPNLTAAFAPRQDAGTPKTRRRIANMLVEGKDAGLGKSRSAALRIDDWNDDEIDGEVPRRAATTREADDDGLDDGDVGQGAAAAAKEERVSGAVVAGGGGAGAAEHEAAAGVKQPYGKKHQMYIGGSGTKRSSRRTSRRTAR